MPSAPRLCSIGDTDSFEYEPSGSSAATSTALWRAYAGAGQRGGVPAGLESFLGELALRLAAFETLAMRQHHGPDGRGDQQCAGEFECPQVAGKISAASPSTLPAAFAVVSPAKPPVATLPMAAMSRMPNPTPAATAATR